MMGGRLWAKDHIQRLVLGYSPTASSYRGMGSSSGRKVSVRALLHPFLFFISFIISLDFCTALDTITSTQSIGDPQSVISGDETFRLGFFSPNNSANRYVGIWYNKIPGPAATIIWVANRDNPLSDSSGIVTIADDGNLVVLDGRNNILWSTNVSNIAGNSSAMLTDSGNLVLREENSNDRILWQSFDHPTDSFLPTMKFGANLTTGEKQLLTSWKSDSDPSTGSFTLGFGPLNIAQLFIWNGSIPHWRSGLWNNRIFIGIPDMDSVYLNGFNIVRDNPEGSLYLTYSYVNKSIYKMVLSSQGIFKLTYWDDETKEWVHLWDSQPTNCDVYDKCGPFGSCDSQNSQICSCLRGFEPKSIEEWSKGNWRGGCVRRSQLQCERKNASRGEEGKQDGFLKLEMMKVPDYANWLSTKDVFECEQQCLRNCSCVAFAYDSGIGCMSWSGDLIDMQKFSMAGVDLHIRVAYSELDAKRNVKVIIIITVLIGAIAIGICTYFSWRWMTKQRGRKKKGMEKLKFDRREAFRETSDESMAEYNTNQREGLEIPFFNFENMVIATNNFHAANKLGQGGFGPVYKGKLLDGREIAVKRLSRSSGQGVEEFKNEVAVISKLQHRNLVRLLGYCTEGEERMLIYEYMPNKSLDAFLFDPTKQALLDWRKRFHIIEGIGRGLLYLHRDSRLKIIHRDLKASNILLDKELNPKISDFGMARIFGGDQDQANTRRVVGTYGYMSPEYAMEGRFSEKSDVFSFGVLLLEIVSGRRNTSFSPHEECLSLLRYAWKLWNEDKILDLNDPTICDPCFQTEVLRCIHVGLLCVQEFARDRPTVSTILSMLCSEIATLPTPKQPAFTERHISSSTDSSSHILCSMNGVTITMFEGR